MRALCYVRLIHCNTPTVKIFHLTPGTRPITVGARLLFPRTCLVSTPALYRVPTVKCPLLGYVLTRTTACLVKLINDQFSQTSTINYQQILIRQYNTSRHKYFFYLLSFSDKLVTDVDVLWHWDWAIRVRGAVLEMTRLHEKNTRAGLVSILQHFYMR